MSARGLRSPCIPLIESVNPACRVNELLLAGKEWVAFRTDLYVQLSTHGRTGLERMSARTGHVYLFVIRMDILLHYIALNFRIWDKPLFYA